MHDTRFPRGVLWISLLWLALCGAAQAQISAADLCQVEAGGLVLTMETYLERKMPEAVALQAAGLTPGGLRARIAGPAYRQLASGANRAAVIQRAIAQCLQLGANAVADEELTFDTARQDGGGAQLCADVSNGIAGFLVQERGANRLGIDAALELYRSSDPRQIETPRLRRAMELALQRARIAPNEVEIARMVFEYCEGLDAAGREQLDAEFYVP